MAKLVATYETYDDDRPTGGRNMGDIVGLPSDPVERPRAAKAYAQMRATGRGFWRDNKGNIRFYIDTEHPNVLAELGAL